MDLVQKGGLNVAEDSCAQVLTLALIIIAALGAAGILSSTGASGGMIGLALVLIVGNICTHFRDVNSPRKNTAILRAIAHTVALVLSCLAVTGVCSIFSMGLATATIVGGAYLVRCVIHYREGGPIAWLVLDRLGIRPQMEFYPIDIGSDE